MSPQYTQHDHGVLFTRGGAISTSAKSDAEEASSLQKVSLRKIAIWTGAMAAVAWLGWEYRLALKAVWNKEALQERVLTILHSFHGDWRGVVAYSCGMAVWELLGMSTIPVETAAGMVFGFRNGFVASAIGKLVGALSAYALGRGILKKFVLEKTRDNRVLKLIDSSVKSHPFRTCLLMRYSCFPEFVKNCGASLFDPIKTWMFILSVMMHGWLYTACWTYFGVDTARRLEPHAGSQLLLPADRLAKFSVAWATIVGMVLTPLIMAWWIRDMQQSQPNDVVDQQKDGNEPEN
jgi:uncharacterized membrane protein YdjX (TVP38/TMEM64 family)